MLDELVFLQKLSLGFLEGLHNPEVEHRVCETQAYRN